MSAVDQDAVQTDSAAALGRLRLHALDEAVGPGDLGIGRREHFVGDRDLGGVDGPLALKAERARAQATGPEALRVCVVGERPVDGPLPVGPASVGDAGEREVPLVVPVPLGRGALSAGQHSVVRVGRSEYGVEVLQFDGIVSNPEDDPFQPGRRGGDRLDIGEALGGLDQDLDA